MNRLALVAALLAACGGEVMPGAGGNPPGVDGAAANPGSDGGASSGADLAQTLSEPPPPPPGGSVGPTGGTVSLLRFGVTGDTRPPSCEDTAGYPTQVITAIATQLKSRGAQFGLDLGDHIYVCNDDLNIATTQMNLYMGAIQSFGGTWFMTEGNHECWKGPCLAGSQNANYVAFMSALAPVSASPYYSINITTSLGLATIVIVADNSWDSTQASWLEQTLSTADRNAKYTIVARHHPEGDSTVSTNGDSMAIIRNHKFALFLSGHNHLYHHMTVDAGRDVIIGTGGSPLVSGGSFWGYAMIDQLPTGRLQITVYDINNATPVDTFTVGPN